MAALDEYEPPRVFIACMTCRFGAGALDVWLQHHARLGVAGVLLRWEAHMDAGCAAVLDTWRHFATVLQFMDSEPSVSAVSELDFDDTPEQTMARQEAFVAAALEHVRACTPARALPTTFLVHIDDDELLFCASGHRVPDAFALVGTAETVIIPNLEAVRVADADDCDVTCPTAPFYDSADVLFRRGLAAYANGKSAARCSVAHIRPRGAHRFSGTPCYTMDESVLVVLHFDVLDIPSWRAKFVRRRYRYESRVLQTVAATPILPALPYYDESVRACAGSDADAARVFQRYRTATGHILDLNQSPQALRRVYYDYAPAVSPLQLPPPMLSVLDSSTSPHTFQMTPPAAEIRRPPPLRVPPRRLFDEEGDKTGCVRKLNPLGSTASDLALL